MLEELKKIEQRYNELERLLAEPEIASDQSQYSKLAKELSQLSGKVALFREFKKVTKEIEDLEGVLKEAHEKEFLELVRKELDI